MDNYDGGKILERFLERKKSLFYESAFSKKETKKEKRMPHPRDCQFCKIRSKLSRSSMRLRLTVKSNGSPFGYEEVIDDAIFYLCERCSDRIKSKGNNIQVSNAPTDQ